MRIWRKVGETEADRQCGRRMLVRRRVHCTGIVCSEIGWYRKSDVGFCPYIGAGAFLFPGPARIYI